MANKKISELTAASSLTGAEQVEVNQGGVSKRTTTQDISDLGGGAVSSVFGRAGAVVAVANDYDASEIQNTPAGNIEATNVQAALNELDTEKAPLASPALTGIPTAPTQSPGDNSTKLATTAYVDANLNASTFLQALYFQQNFI